MIWWQITGTLLRKKVQVSVADGRADCSRSETPEIFVTGRQLDAARFPVCSSSTLAELDLVFIRWFKINARKALLSFQPRDQNTTLKCFESNRI